MMSAIGVLMLWSFIATTLLLREWFVPATMPETIVAEVPVAAKAEIEAPKTPSTSEPAKQLMPVAVANEKFELESGFTASDVSLRKIDNNTLELSFVLQNEDGLLQEGFIWARASLEAGEKTLTISSSSNAQIQEDGSANRPRSGDRFAIRNRKKRTLQLKGANFKDAKLVQLYLGAYFRSTETQKVVSLY